MIDLLFSDLLAKIDFALETLRRESGDVETVVVEDCEKELEAVTVEDFGDFITDQTALLKASDVGLEDEGLVAAANVEAGDIKSHAGTNAGRAGWRAGTGRQARCEFQADAVGEGVAFSLLYLDENILLRVGAAGILNGRVDLAEDTKIIELALCSQKILLAEGLSRNHLNFALHHVVAGVVEPSDQHSIDEELFALLDGVSNVLAIRRTWGRVRGDIQDSVGKTVIEVVVEDGPAVGREILFGIRLTGRSIQLGKRFRVNLLISDDVECADESLRAFFDLNVNREMVSGAAIIVVDLGFDLGLAESVGNIQGLKTGDVVLEQGFTVASWRKETAGGLNLQALAEHLPGKIFVPTDLDAFELVHRAGIDTVDHPDAVRTAFLLKIYRGIEMTTSLEVGQKVAFTFVEQVIVECVLLVNRNFPFQHSAADVKTLCVYHDDGSRFDQEGIVDGVGFRTVFLFGDGNLGQDPLLLLELLAQMLKRIGDAARPDPFAGVHPGDVLNLALGKFRMTTDPDFADVSGLTRSNVKQNAHLLGGGIGSAFRRHSRTVVAVLLHELADVLQSTVELVAGMEFAELEFGGVDDLVIAGMAGSAFNVDGTHKEVGRSREG